MTFLYFAYGSNMLPKRLEARCRSARVIGAATATGYDLGFSKRSVDGSGKATLIVATDIVTPGVIFEIAKVDLGSLDDAEGAGYKRSEEFNAVLTDTGEQVSATTYIASEIDCQLKPFDWYLALVIAGAHYHALSEAYKARLRGIEHRVDNNHDRKSRREALQVLSAHGFFDHHVLLGATL